MMRGREREHRRVFFFLGQEESCRQVGSKVLNPFFGVFLLLFCSSCLEKETLFLLLQLEKHHPETKNCILIAVTKVTPPGDPKKPASLLLQTQETPPRDKKKLHPCCCKFKKHHPETKKKPASLLQTHETPPRDLQKTTESCPCEQQVSCTPGERDIEKYCKVNWSNNDQLTISF